LDFNLTQFNLLGVIVDFCKINTFCHIEPVETNLLKRSSTSSDWH